MGHIWQEEVERHYKHMVRLAFALGVIFTFLAMSAGMVFFIGLTDAPVVNSACVEVPHGKP